MQLTGDDKRDEEYSIAQAFFSHFEYHGGIKDRFKHTCFYIKNIDQAMGVIELLHRFVQSSEMLELEKQFIKIVFAYGALFNILSNYG